MENFIFCAVYGKALERFLQSSDQEGCRPPPFQKKRPIYRNSRQRRSAEKGVLRNFAQFTGKYLSQILFFNKVAGLGLQLY